MRVYIAAPWVRKADARMARERLQQEGMLVTSRWLDSPEYPQDAADIMRRESHDNLIDIRVSDVLLVLNLEKSEGKAFEQCYAYCHSIPVVVVGKPTNVFQYLPSGFTLVDTIDDAVETIRATV